MGMSLCINEIGDKNNKGGFWFKDVDSEYPEHAVNGLAGAKYIAGSDFDKIRVVSGHKEDYEQCWRPKNFDDARNWIKNNSKHNIEAFTALMDLLESNEKLYLFDSW